MNQQILRAQPESAVAAWASKSTHFSCDCGFEKSSIGKQSSSWIWFQIAVTWSHSVPHGFHGRDVGIAPSTEAKEVLER